MNNENKNNNNLLMYIIIILLIILIGIGGVLVYRSYSDNNVIQDNGNVENNNDENNKVENNDRSKDESLENDTDNDEVIVENLSLNSDLINTIVKKIEYFKRIEFNHSEMGNAGDRFGLLYKKDKLLIRDLPSEIRMDYVLESFDLETEAEFDGINKYTIDKNKFKQKYIELMGKDVKIELVSYDWKCPGAIIENNNIIIYMACGETWGPAYQIYKKYTRAEKVNNEIYLYEKIAVVDQNSLDESNKLGVYSDLEHSNLVANNVKENETEIFSSKYIDKYSEYKYTFKLEDGNYIFYSVEKVK